MVIENSAAKRHRTRVADSLRRHEVWHGEQIFADKSSKSLGDLHNERTSAAMQASLEGGYGRFIGGWKPSRCSQNTTALPGRYRRE